MSKRMFADVGLEREYAEKGFVVIDFLNADEVEQLRTLYNKHYSNVGNNFFASQYDPDQASKLVIYESIIALVKPKVAKIFYQAETFIASFLIKPASSQSEVSPHLDWTFVDEEKYNTCTIWCPLVDCDEKNGTLEVLEGSHNFLSTLRGSPIFPFPYQGIEMYKYMKLYNVKAGQALIYDHRLVHGSKNNVSATDRIAIGIGVKPVEADLFHYHQQPNGKIGKYKADTEFFHNFKYGSEPDASRLMEEVVFNFPTMTEAKLKETLYGPELVVEEGFLKKAFKSIFK